MTQIIDSRDFDQKVRRIRVQVSTVLTKWGLLPRFKRWRLTQDPDTGMVVLFGILNNRYIATHTSIPFSDYFDVRLLQDLTNELQVQVVSCNSDGLRYAFILDRGQFGRLPTHIDFPFIDNGKLLARVVYNDSPRLIPTPLVNIATADDHTLIHQGVGAFLKVFDDIKLRDDAVLELSRQKSPDIVVIDHNEFNKKVTEQEANFRRNKHLKELFGKSAE